MEIIGSLFAGLTSAATTAASGLSAALATPAVSAGLTGLQIGGGLLSILSKQRAGQEKKDAYFQTAAEAEIDAQAEGVAGLQRQGQIRKQLVDALSERDLAAAAGGLDLGFGTPQQARAEATADAERALSIDRLETENRQARLRQRSASAIRAGRSASRGALLESLGTALDTVTDVASRGTTPRRSGRARPLDITANAA